MKLTWDVIYQNAVAFSHKWRNASSEQSESQPFMLDFIQLFGVDDPLEGGTFESTLPMRDGTTGYIDYFWPGHIAIEMKSRGKNLAGAYKQLKKYMDSVEADDIPDLWMVSDFEHIRLTRRSTGEYFGFKTENLADNIKRFADLAGYARGLDGGRPDGAISNFNFIPNPPLGVI